MCIKCNFGKGFEKYFALQNGQLSKHVLFKKLVALITSHFAATTTYIYLLVGLQQPLRTSEVDKVTELQMFLLTGSPNSA